LPQDFIVNHSQADIKIRDHGIKPKFAYNSKNNKKPANGSYRLYPRTSMLEERHAFA